MAIAKSWIRSAVPYDDDANYLFDDLIAAERRHFWFQNRRELVLWAMDRYLPGTRRFLEVGCGTGLTAQTLRERYPQIQVAACDMSLHSVAQARARASHIHLFRADVRRLPVRGGFDVIAALDVLEHVTNDTDALREMCRALRPGGGLLVTVPQHQWLWSEVDVFSHHRRRYHRNELLAKVKAAGFEAVWCTSYFCATLPFALASRFLKRRDRFDPSAELKIAGALNAVFGLLLQPETWLIKAGLSLPIGGSLVMVARRP